MEDLIDDVLTDLVANPMLQEQGAWNIDADNMVVIADLIGGLFS